MNTLIRCPECGAPPVHRETCEVCGFRFERVEVALDLRTDKSYDTLLEVEEYDAEHGVSEAPDPKIFATYQALMEGAGLTPAGSVLEIACGSGNLTASMLAAGCFDAVHCGDISPAFMRILAKRIRGISTPTRVEAYLFDANRLPFRDSSFDFVLGNSVLHHFAEFERTIADAFRVLKPGGAALFGEPLFDTHALVSLAAGLIARSPEAMSVEGMTTRHVSALKVIAGRVAGKRAALLGDRAALRHVEDKFMFPAGLLHDLGAEIGYSRVVISGVPPAFRLGAAAKLQITRVLRMTGLSTAPLDAFEHVFEALSEDYGTPMHDYLHPVFAQIAFVR